MMLLKSVLLVISSLLLSSHVQTAEPDLWSHRFGLLTTWLNTEGYVRHLEMDTFQQGNILFSDHNALKTSNGHSTATIAGDAMSQGYVDDIGVNARFNGVYGFVQINSSSVVLADHSNGCLRNVDRLTTFTETFAGKCTNNGFVDGFGANARFTWPYDVIMIANKLYVTDSHSGVIRIIDIPTRIVSTWIRNDKLTNLRGLILDPSSGFMFATKNDAILKIIPIIKSVTVLTSTLAGFKDGPISDAQFNNPAKLDMIANDTLLVPDLGNNKIRLVELLTGQVSSPICTGDWGSHDGPVDTCKLASPQMVLIVNDTLYIGDYKSVKRLKISELDECKAGIDNCDDNALCKKTSGGVTCTCAQGFTGNGFKCTDIDECSLNIDNCTSDVQCVNTDGGFTCTCPQGFTGDGGNCTRINPCQTDTHGCGIDAICHNVHGYAFCLCKSGFSGDGHNCTDIDECLLKTDNCDNNAQCENTFGGFVCTCAHGFSGDGVTCTEVGECSNGIGNCSANTTGLTCQCPQGFTHNGLNCTDVDECKLKTDNCADNALCENTHGGFTCTCIQGYSGNGVECADSSVSRVVQSWEGNASSFIYSRGLYNSLSEFTMCMWLDLSSTTSFNGKYLLSYAVPGKSDEFSLSFNTSSWVVNYRGKNFSSAISSDDFSSLRQWRKHCWVLKTISSDHQLEWYADNDVELVLFKSITVPVVKPLSADGILVLFNGPDSASKVQNGNHTLGAKMSWFNMWKQAFTLNQLNQLTCQDSGNLLDMNDFGSRGNPYTTNIKSPCQDADASNRSLTFTTRYMVSCDKVSGIALTVIKSMINHYTAEVEDISGYKVKELPVVSCSNDQISVMWITDLTFKPTQKLLPALLTSIFYQNIIERQQQRHAAGYFYITIVGSNPPVVQPTPDSDGLLLSPGLTDPCPSGRNFDVEKGTCAARR